QRSTVLLVPRSNLVPRIRVTLPAQMLERVGGRDAADSGGDLVRLSEREAFHQPAAKRVTDAGRIDDAVRRDGRDVVLTAGRDHARAFFAPRDDEHLGDSQDVALAHAGLLTEQLELVVVDDDDRRAGDAVLQRVAIHARALLAGIEDERDAERAALLGVLH